MASSHRMKAARTFHATALEAAGIRSLDDGQTVSFELTEDRGKTSATSLKVS